MGTSIRSLLFEAQFSKKNPNNKQDSDRRRNRKIALGAGALAALGLGGYGLYRRLLKKNPGKVVKSAINRNNPPNPPASGGVISGPPKKPDSPAAVSSPPPRKPKPNVVSANSSNLQPKPTSRNESLSPVASKNRRRRGNPGRGGDGGASPDLPSSPRPIKQPPILPALNPIPPVRQPGDEIVPFRRKRKGNEIVPFRRRKAPVASYSLRRPFMALFFMGDFESLE
jgi:hypothetical protein